MDRLGTKRLYLLCFSSFTIASTLCGMARTMPELVGARIIQGITGGLMAPLAQLMLARVAGKQMARVVGFSAVPILIAPLAGPILAGVILKHMGWPWIFFVNVPVGILAAALATWIFPHDGSETRQRSFDLLGFLLISPGLVSLLYGFEQTSHCQGAWFLVLGSILVAGFIGYAKRKKAEALIDIEFFKNRTFRTAAVTQFLSNGIMYGGQLLIPLFLVTGCQEIGGR